MIIPDWPAPPGIHAVTTTRDGGVSESGYRSLNLADHVGDAPAAVAQNRARLRESLQLPAEPVWLSQVHGNRVVDAGGATLSPQADGAWSSEAGVVCAVLTADCLPVLMCDTAGTRIAAAHAGWRGLAGGVLEAAVAALDGASGELMAWLGPAIGPECFEVGPEVRQAFVEAHPQAAGAFRAGTGDRWLADIYRLARIRLAAAGVKAVYGGGLCTLTDAARFYSYRREPVTGRMASLIWMS